MTYYASMMVVLVGLKLTLLVLLLGPYLWSKLRRSSVGASSCFPPSVEQLVKI